MFLFLTICGIFSSINGDGRNPQNKKRNNSTVPVVIVNNEEDNAPKSIVKSNVQVGLSQDAISNHPLQGNMCPDGNKIAGPVIGKYILRYFSSKISSINLFKFVSYVSII